MSKPFLSIIIPVHNEAERLPPSLAQINAFLKQQDYLAEVIVVENGSSDNTFEIAKAYTRKMSNLSVEQVDSRGKGLAVRHGMLAAQGQYRFMCDADLSMPVEQIPRFLPTASGPMDVVIGSREVEGSNRYDEPKYRHLIGRIFNAMARWLVLPGLQDTQCGFKCFRGEVAEEVFPLQTLTGMSFDAEVLFIARQKGYRVQEVPIDWTFNPDSRVRIFKDSMRMGLDLLTIRWRSICGKYGTQEKI